MRNVQSKLKSQSGASILIALVFFLLCMTVGAVILTAATANAGRISHMERDQQDYLTVSSAARLLREELSGQTYVWTTVTVDGVETLNDCTQPAGGALGSALSADAELICGASPVQPSLRAFTLSAEGLENVSATLLMDGDFNLTVTAALDGEGKNLLTLTIPAQDHTESTSTTEYFEIKVGLDDAGNPIYDLVSTTTVTDVRTITWGEGTITKGAATK